MKSFVLIPKIQPLLQSSSGPFTHENEIKLYLTGSHCHNFQLLYNRIGLLCKNQEKRPIPFLQKEIFSWVKNTIIQYWGQKYRL